MSHTATAAHGHAPDVQHVVQQAIAKVQVWRAGIARLHQALQHCAINPAESIYQIAGIKLLPGADMKEPMSHLRGMEAAIGQVDRGVAELGKATAHVAKAADVKKLVDGIEAEMRLARYEGAATAHSIQKATQTFMDRDVGVAGKLLAADQAVIDKVPEIAGDIMLAITEREEAKVLMEQGTKLALNAAANASAAAQGVDISAQMPSFGNASLGAGIDIIAGLVPGGPDKLTALLLAMVVNMNRDMLKLALQVPKPEGPAMHKAMATIVNTNVIGTLDKVAGEFPLFKSPKVRLWVSKPFLKAFVDAEKAYFEGKPITDALLAGFATGLVGAKVARKAAAEGGAHDPSHSGGAHAAGPQAKPAHAESPLGHDSYVGHGGKPGVGAPAPAHAGSPLGHDSYVGHGGKPGAGAPAAGMKTDLRGKQDQWLGTRLNLHVDNYPPP